MKLARYIATLGYGSRRDVERLCASGRITRQGGHQLTATDEVGHEIAHDDIRVDGAPLDVAVGTVVMLHKPVGYVCSTREASRLVYELLPPRFRERTPVIAPVGRLDRDSSGLLLLTDDGPLNHRITSPRTHLAKVYEVRLAADLRGDEGNAFASGAMTLAGESAPLRPASLEVLDARRARVTITEGRYHQLRRMFAALGNHVDALHRAALGPLMLGDLPAGEWRTLDEGERAELRHAVGAR